VAIAKPSALAPHCANRNLESSFSVQLFIYLRLDCVQRKHHVALKVRVWNEAVSSAKGFLCIPQKLCVCHRPVPIDWQNDMPFLSHSHKASEVVRAAALGEGKGSEAIHISPRTRAHFSLVTAFPNANVARPSANCQLLLTTIEH